MKQLVDAGLVSREQRGKWAYYRVVDEAMNGVATNLAFVTSRRSTDLSPARTT